MGLESFNNADVVKAENGRYFITGGYLNPNVAWTPSHITAIDGEPFLQLHKRDRMFAKLCGTDLAFNSVLDDLMNTRNLACKQAEDMALAENDPPAAVRLAAARCAQGLVGARERAGDAPAIERWPGARRAHDRVRA